MTLGAIGVSTGFPGVYHLLDGSASGDHYTGLAAVAAGLVLLAVGPVVLWKSRRRAAAAGAATSRRAGTLGIAVVAAAVAFVVLVFPIGFSYGYTHIGRTSASVDEVGLPHEPVTLTTSDGIELSAAYVPSKNGAAVVVFPGAAALKEARMIARNGYGVLLLDPRGQGKSGGDNVRWAGDRDLIAAAEYLQSRPDVDPDRIAGFGSSVGGEILIEAAAQSDAFAAVVSEGAGLRIGEGADLMEGAERLMTPAFTTLTARHDRVLEPRPAAAARRADRAHRAAPGLPDLRRSRRGRRDRAAARLLRGRRRAEADVEGARRLAHRRHRRAAGRVRATA